MTVLEVGGQVTQLRFLSDGRLLIGVVLESGDCAIEVRSLPTDNRVRLPLVHRQSWHEANGLAVHPAGDRVYLASGELTTVSTTDGTPVAGPSGRPADQVITSPDGSRLVVAHRTSHGETVTDGLSASGEQLWQVTYPHPRYYNLAGVLADGERFVMVGVREVVVRPFSAGGAVAATRYPSYHVNHPQLSPDGRHLGVMGYHSFYVYDTVALGKPRTISGSRSSGNFVGFAFHPAGRTLAVIHGGPTLVKLYDLDTLALRARLNWKVGPLSCLAFSPDGLLGAAGTHAGRVVVWDADE